MSTIYFACSDEISDAFTQSKLTEGDRVAFLAFNTRENALKLLKERQFSQASIYQVETSNIDTDLEVQHFPCQRGFVYLITDDLCSITELNSSLNWEPPPDKMQIILMSIQAFELRLKLPNDLANSKSANLPNAYHDNVTFIRQIINNAEKGYKQAISALQQFQQYKLAR